MDSKQTAAPLSQRDAFWNEVYDIARADPRVMIVSADMGAPALDRFRRDLGAQFVNVGIAEQNAVTVSAGLSLSGMKVFTYAIAPFITLRCYEQTKCVLAAMKVPVTLVGVGAGFSYDDSGPTHHTVEDLAVMRILPSMTVHSVTDGNMARWVARTSCGLAGPNYVRLDRQPWPDVYRPSDDFARGLTLLRDGRDAVMVTTGTVVHQALRAAEALAPMGVSCGVIDLHTLPVNGKLLIEALDGVKRVFTVEEYTLDGGLGGAVCEVLADHGRQVTLKRLALDFREGYCYRYGGRQNLLRLHGLDAESLAETVSRAVRSAR